MQNLQEQEKQSPYMKMDTLQSSIVELFSVAAFGFQILYLYFYMKYKRSQES